MKQNYFIWPVLVFCGLAASFLLEVWGTVPPIKQQELVDLRFIDKATVRDPQLGDLKLSKIGFTYECSSCHQHFELLEQKHERVAEHTTITLRHGENDRCANCHHPEDVRSLVTHDGSKIDPAHSEQLCKKCHGPKHRDWQAGVHGRQNGYWDLNLGPSVKSTCVSCHDPHAPTFLGLKPAPGPKEDRSEALSEDKGTSHGHH